VDLSAVRAAFDQQLRRSAVAGPESRVERDARVTREVGSDGSWTTVLWSHLSEADADEVIAAELAGARGHFEWKYYSGDRPADLPDRLRAAGLVPEPVEGVLVADLAELPLPLSDPPGVRLTRVDEDAGVAAMTGVHREVFGGVHPGTASAVRASLALEPRPVEAVVAWADGRPISAGRIQYSEGTGFAGLFGGGTVAHWRGRGVFRALVAWRAAQARSRGVRYLYVDAVPMSRPIFERLGFVLLAETTPWMRGVDRA
jgi:GNAT superfamily N-acetyltransferase